MSDNVMIVNKKMGQTPLDCIKELKNAKPELTLLPMTYAGRLDPLAEGVLIILIGEECLKKDEYLSLSKEYEVDVLFGFATDTYDVMGKVIKTASSLCQFSGPRMREDEEPDHENWHKDFASKLLKFTGKFSQAYPPYSSRTVDGKPLFKWAREGRLSEIEIPAHDVFVDSIAIIKEDFIKGEDLLEKIKSNISQVKGDFRQEEIIKIWEDNLQNKNEEKYKIITLRISCGGGVYVRGIAHSLGEKLGIPALALRIVRTKVGEYRI